MPHLIDRNPGAFVVAANAVVYGVIALEAWMCTTSSYVALAGVLGLIVTTAVLIGRAVWRLLDDEDGTGVPIAEPAPAATPHRRVLRAARPHAV